MKRLPGLLLCLFLVIGLSAGEKDKVLGESFGVKRSLGPAALEFPLMESQVTRGDKARILMLTSYVTDEAGEIMHCLDLSLNQTISFWIDFTAVYSTDVRFHFIWSGPEFYWHETDWYELGYKDYYYLSVDTDNNWRKGTYKLVIIAEQDGFASGAETVMECHVRFY